MDVAMGEMKKIVTVGVLVDELPEHVRHGIDSGTRVKVTVESGAEAPAKPRPLHQMRGFAEGLYASQGIDPVEFIRQLRDEWD
jgi:hypothetical protein